MTNPDPQKVAALSRLFKITDQARGVRVPLVLTPSQQEIFNAIVTRSHSRYIVISCSQYGKSETVSIAVLLRAVLFPEKWVIVAPTIPKTMIIMRKIIDHIFDDPLFSSQLEVSDSLERLRREKSKTRLTFRGGGEISILSADTKNKSAQGESLMGHGCVTSETRVKTNEGEKTIEEVVTNKFQGSILSFDFSSHRPVWKRIIGHFPNKRSGRRLLKISTGSSSLVLTEDHPIHVVGKGFIKAKEVVEGDKILASETA